MGARFLARLPSLLRHPLENGEARRILHDRLERREEIFLANVEQSIFFNAASPYLPLFRNAGCTSGDLTRLVRSEGVEAALLALFRDGVYLSVDEFKGRRDVVRGSLVIQANPDLLRNRQAEFHLPVRSGGSRSGGTPVMMDLAFVRGCAVNASLVLEARGGSDWVKATWETPGAGARFRLLKYSSFGKPPARWFSQVDPDDPGLDSIFRWSERVMRWGSGMCGIRMPRPQHVPLDDPLEIATWMRQVLDEGATPHVFTFPSSALRLCESAVAAGIDLGGAEFTVGGEPSTDARLKGISKSGAHAAPRYGSMECGPIGYGCLTPAVSDDTHLQHDLHALIQPGASLSTLPADALFITSLHPRSPFTLFNVSMGDRATLSTQRCGCPLEKLGWATHVHSIRSFEKLTAGGMTFFDTDVIRILEEELPARFGGSGSDYQLLEQERPNGSPGLNLLIHPSLGPLDEAVVLGFFIERIGGTSSVERMMGTMWRDSAFLTVKRLAPMRTNAGKVLHLHSNQSR